MFRIDVFFEEMGTLRSEAVMLSIFSCFCLVFGSIFEGNVASVRRYWCCPQISGSVLLPVGSN